MAIFEVNPAFENLKGKTGNIVLYTRNGVHYSRKYVIPANPNTEAQKKHRSAFSDAVKAWHELSSGEKKEFNVRADKRKLHMSGYNLFISEFLKEQTQR